MVNRSATPETLDPVRRRLLELADERRVSLSELSRMIGKNPSYLQQFVRKGSPRKLEEGDRATLARFFEVDEAQLAGGAQEKEISYDSPDVDQWVSVPRLSLGAAAGAGALHGGEGQIGTLRFSGRWLRAQGFAPDALSAIGVTGDSMEPTLRDGDEILVDTRPRPLRDGVHVVRMGEGLLVKRLDTARPGRIVLLSDNPAYRAIDCATDDVAVIGRVVWKSGRL